jgi:predicted nucleic acid-binding protein
MFLIDTDILIYALKGKDPVESRIEKEISSPCAISIITYGEL